MGRKKVSEGPRGHNFKGDDSSDRCRPGPGHGATYTEEFGKRLIDALWSGEAMSLVELAELDWAPTRQTINNWKNRYPEFGASITEAQIALGDLYVHANRKIVSDMLSGVLDPSAANVAIKSNQWVAQNVDPRTYGNKSYVHKDETKRVEHTFTNRIPVEDLSEEELDALEGALIKSRLMITGPTQN